MPLVQTSHSSYKSLWFSSEKKLTKLLIFTRETFLVSSVVPVCTVLLYFFSKVDLYSIRFLVQRRLTSDP